jgi:nucleotide-binding universal stress UspA family protein
VSASRRSWLERLTGGGLGEKLLHVSPVPVVLVRAT